MAARGNVGSRHGPLSELLLSKSGFTGDVLNETVWLNTVGMFGVGSAGHYCRRAGAAVMRLTHYFQAWEHMLRSMLYSDANWITADGDHLDRDLVFQLMVLAIVGTPLARHKLRGGTVLEWIRYALDVARFEIGIAETRIQWAISWLGDKIREGCLRLSELREGLGRLQFIAGEHLRPSLGPLYAWASAGLRYSRPRIPVMTQLIMELSVRELSVGGTLGCTGRGGDLGEVFRFDAKAEGESVAIGGCRCRGMRWTKQAPWFAVSLTRRNVPMGIR